MTHTFFYTMCVCLYVCVLELYTLLLEDILVLLQKQDEKLVLKCHSKNRVGSADSRDTFSPIIRLDSLLVRSVATGNDSRDDVSETRSDACAITRVRQMYSSLAQDFRCLKIFQDVRRAFIHT